MNYLATIEIVKCVSTIVVIGLLAVFAFYLADTSDVGCGLIESPKQRLERARKSSVALTAKKGEPK